MFYDIQLGDVTGVESLAIEFRPADGDKAIYHWNGENRRSALTKATMKRQDVYGDGSYSWCGCNFKAPRDAELRFKPNRREG